MLGSFVPRLARYGIFHSPPGKRFNYLCDTLRGKPSVLAEPVEDLFVVLCPFIPFGTCGWGSQPHTAIITVWQFILISVSISYVLVVLNVSQNRILKAQAMPFGVTFWYHSQKSMSSRFNVLSGSCLTAGGHTALFINQVYIILINSFVIPGSITNRVGREARACAFSCIRAHDIIVCSSGVHLVPFFPLAISRASLNSGLSREHMCCHVFLPACVFPSGLGNTPVTEIGGSPFPHRGAILDVGGNAWPFFLCHLNQPEVGSESELENPY